MRENVVGRFDAIVIHHRELGSTSDEAKRLLAAGSPAPPFVVRADRQTAGRGRPGRSWWSDAGSLTFTVGLDPRACGLNAFHWPRIALATAVGIIEALEPPLPPGTLGIRWPNDLEAAGRKLAGLLPELVETPHGPRLALGIGLNVTTDLTAAPPEVRPMATSLAALLGRPLSLDEVLDRVLDRLGTVLAALARDDPALAERWSRRDTLLGRPVRIDQSGAILSGVGRGVDPRGVLWVESQGRLVPISGGQVLRGEPNPLPPEDGGSAADG
jgi:BirA family biotin operon repressor/biotin-[acetyl-CoA-carboxylase] ligase